MKMSGVKKALSPNKEERPIEEFVDSKNVALSAGALAVLSTASGNYEVAQGSAMVAGTATVAEMEGEGTIKEKVNELRGYEDNLAEELDQEIKGRYVSRVDGDNREVLQNEKVRDTLQSWAATGEDQYRETENCSVEVSTYSNGRAAVSVYGDESKKGMDEIDAVVKASKGLL